MGPAYQGQAVVAIELLDAALPKKEAGAPGGNSPPIDIVGVGPHEVAHGASIGNFLFALNDSDIIDVGD